MLQEITDETRTIDNSRTTKTHKSTSAFHYNVHFISNLNNKYDIIPGIKISGRFCFVDKSHTHMN